MKTMDRDILPKVIRRLANENKANNSSAMTRLKREISLRAIRTWIIRTILITNQLIKEINRRVLLRTQLLPKIEIFPLITTIGIFPLITTLAILAITQI